MCDRHTVFQFEHVYVLLHLFIDDKLKMRSIMGVKENAGEDEPTTGQDTAARKNCFHPDGRCIWWKEQQAAKLYYFLLYQE